MFLTLLSRKWPDTGLTPLELTLVLSHLLALALGFELQVEGLENIWLISAVILRPHTHVVTWRYITFEDGGQG
jgi:1-acyl-sn-glycerol-3-phosphate acyltransferase